MSICLLMVILIPKYITLGSILLKLLTDKSEPVWAKSNLTSKTHSTKLFEDLSRQTKNFICGIECPISELILIYVGEKLPTQVSRHRVSTDMFQTFQF